ncbi:unnamed protein product [Prorocentrum cordatum]|uniref:Uncharacterized protein n=1 Tax=Prorocentrum cordatum TaxID=2364126 RepID=A0ABN9W5T6_9DINO|nr:unnamed protein product [Polarella glacialis]
MMAPIMRVDQSLFSFSCGLQVETCHLYDVTRYGPMLAPRTRSVAILAEAVSAHLVELSCGPGWLVSSAMPTMRRPSYDCSLSLRVAPLLFVCTSSIDTCSLVGGNFMLKTICETFAGSSKQTDLATAGLQVIGAGAGRTGTASLQVALDILGYNCYHMREVLINGDSSAWMGLLTGKIGVEDIVSMLVHKGFTATADDPASAFALEFVEHLPDVKVILTTRTDPEKWLDSLQQLATLEKVSSWLPLAIIPRFVNFGKMAVFYHAKRGYAFDPDFMNRSVALQWYNDHNANIRARVPKDRLLDFQVTDGWEPLCSFLGKPIPNVPFPRVNDKDGFNFALAFLECLHWVILAVSVLIVVCAMVACCRAGRPKVKVH